jgi:hypothetical protein
MIERRRPSLFAFGGVLYQMVGLLLLNGIYYLPSRLSLYTS